MQFRDEKDQSPRREESLRSLFARKIKRKKATSTLFFLLYNLAVPVTVAGNQHVSVRGDWARTKQFPPLSLARKAKKKKARGVLRKSSDPGPVPASIAREQSATPCAAAAASFRFDEAPWHLPPPFPCLPAFFVVIRSSMEVSSRRCRPSVREARPPTVTWVKGRGQRRDSPPEPKLCSRRELYLT